MKKLITAISIVIFGLSYSSCYYDKEETLYGPGNCDTAGTISYTQRIVPLFQQYCYSCHTGSFPSGNITMGTYADDKAIGVNGKLYGSISHTAGFSPMPQGQPMLNSCQIATVKKWVDAGMLNN